MNINEFTDAKMALPCHQQESRAVFEVGREAVGSEKKALAV